MEIGEREHASSHSGCLSPLMFGPVPTYKVREHRAESEGELPKEMQNLNQVRESLHESLKSARKHPG